MDRADLEAVCASGNLSFYELVIARNTLNSLKLFMDYRDFNAYEREWRLSGADPEWAEWADSYKRIFGMDEYAEEDRHNFLGYGEYRMDPYTGIAEVGNSST